MLLKLVTLLSLKTNSAGIILRNDILFCLYFQIETTSEVKEPTSNFYKDKTKIKETQCQKISQVFNKIWTNIW